MRKNFKHYRNGSNMFRFLSLVVAHVKNPTKNKVYIDVVTNRNSVRNEKNFHMLMRISILMKPDLKGFIGSQLLYIHA